MALKKLFSKKNSKKFPSGSPQTPICDLLTISPNSDNFENLLDFWFKSFFFSKTQVTCQPRPRFLILHSMVSLSRKKLFFSKNFVDVFSCDLQFNSPPPVKNSDFAYAPCQCFFLTLITFDEKQSFINVFDLQLRSKLQKYCNCNCSASAIASKIVALQACAAIIAVPVPTYDYTEYCQKA